MTFLAQIQQDAMQISTTDFALPVIWTITNGVTVLEVTCNAIAMRHTIQQFDELGRPIAANGRAVRVTVSELALKQLGFPVRDTSNAVNLKNARLTWTDVSGVQASYAIRNFYPDDTLGLILCQCADYGTVPPPGKIIIGWIASPIQVSIVNNPDPTQTQTLANGDVIPVQYALNNNGTLTIPYLVGYPVLVPFIIDNGVIQDEPYNQATGTFDNAKYGGFLVGNQISFNATIPIWQS